MQDSLQGALKSVADQFVSMPLTSRLHWEMGKDSGGGVTYFQVIARNWDELGRVCRFIMENGFGVDVPPDILDDADTAGPIGLDGYDAWRQDDVDPASNANYRKVVQVVDLEDTLQDVSSEFIALSKARRVGVHTSMNYSIGVVTLQVIARNWDELGRLCEWTLSPDQGPIPPELLDDAGESGPVDMVDYLRWANAKVSEHGAF